VTYLLDTNVLSETRKRQPAAGVAGWIAATPPDLLHVSGMWRPGSKIGFSRSPSRSRLPGAASRSLARGRTGLTVPCSRLGKAAARAPAAAPDRDTGNPDED
jgi:hypothetical protein